MKTRKAVIESGQRRPVKVRGLVVIKGWYHYRPRQIRGVRPPREALHTQDFDEAVRLALLRQRETEITHRAGTLEFETTRCLTQRRYRSRWTRDADASVLRLFCAFAGGRMQAGAVGSEMIERWKREMQAVGRGGRPMAEGTVVTYLARVSSFFRWLKEDGVLARNPCTGVKLPKVRRTRVDRFCTKPERDGLLERCGRDDLRLVLMMGFHAGLRLNEIVQARCEWLRFWEHEGEWHGEIVVHRTATFTPKDREARSIPMNRVLLGFLRPLFHDGGHDGAEFVVRPEVEQGKDKYRWNPRLPFRRLMDKEGLGWVGVHTMRHTYATHLVMGGVPIKTVALWLGDDEITTARTYAGYLRTRDHVEAGV